MGKKRTNAARKKQVAKKKKLSSAYGVSVLKGGPKARNNNVVDVIATAGTGGANPRAKKQDAAPNRGGRAKNDAAPSNYKSTGRTISTCEKVKRAVGMLSSEHDEFKRMHASLQERSLASQSRKDDHQRRKKGRQKHQKKGWGKFVGPSTTNFTPATFTLSPKSTQELVDDAADHVAQGMNEIGQRSSRNLKSSDVVVALPGQSSLAAAASDIWKLRVSNLSEQAQQKSQTQNNPFVALDIDTDSDNEWVDKKEKSLPQFQFKPASFSFQPTLSNPLEAVENAAAGEDIDPDL